MTFKINQKHYIFLQILVNVHKNSSFTLKPIVFEVSETEIQLQTFILLFSVDFPQKEQIMDS